MDTAAAAADQSNAKTGTSKVEKAASVPTESSSSPSLPASASAPASPLSSRYGRDGSNADHGGSYRGRTDGHWESRDHWRHRPNSDQYGKRWMNERRDWDRDKERDRDFSFNNWSLHKYSRPPNSHWQRNDYLDRYSNRGKRYGVYECPKSRYFHQNYESNELNGTETNLESNTASKANKWLLETPTNFEKQPENKESSSVQEKRAVEADIQPPKFFIPNKFQQSDQNSKTKELKGSKNNWKSKRAFSCLLETAANLKEQSENKEIPFSGQAGDASQIVVTKPSASNSNNTFSFLEAFHELPPPPAAEPESSQTYPRIKVRPLAELLKQEILAVTQENRLRKAAPPKRPGARLCPKAGRKNHRPVCGFGNTPASPTSINSHLANLDKESLKYIVNNSDTIYDEPLQYKARKRLREEIRRQLKEFQLEKPKDSPATELIEDDIVDAIKLPPCLLQEIEKCFGIDISGSEKPEIKTEPDITSGECINNNTETLIESIDNNTETLIECIDNNTETLIECTNNNSEPLIEGINNSSATEQIASPQRSKKSPTEEQNSSPQAKDSPIEPHKKNPTEDHNSSPQAKDSPIEPHKKSPTEDQNSSPQTKDSPIDHSKKSSEPKESTPTETMAGARDLMTRLKAADEVKTMTAVRQYNGRPTGSFPPRGPLLPFPKQDKKLGNSQRSERKTSESSPKKAKPKEQTKKGNTPKATSPAVVAPEPIIAIKQEIKDCEIVLPISKSTTIVVSSSSDEDEGEEDATQKRTVAKPNDDDASDNSNSSHGSTESSKRRYRQKLQSDADNVVDSFEKLILPHLKDSLAETYRRQHSGSQHTRLHFISCVVTSSEYNTQSISKVEIAKVQKNLKLNNNRLGIEFLLRQIVHVVNQQKQQASAQRRKEQEEQKLSNGISTVKSAASANAESAKETPQMPPYQRVAEVTAVALPPPNESPRQSSPAPSTYQQSSPAPSVHQSSPVPSVYQSSPSLFTYQSPPARQSPPVLPPRQSPPVLPPRQSPPVLPPRQSPPVMPPRQSPPVMPPHAINPSFGVFPSGIPFLDVSFPRISPGAYSLSDSSEPMGLLADMMAQNLLDIDRRLLENQNRRSFLDEMIMKFQKEKSDLEMHSQDLQCRKFMLFKSAITQKHGPTTAPAVMMATPPTPASPTNSPPPTAEGQAAAVSVSAETSSQNKASNQRRVKPRGRVRRAVVVKYLPKRRVRFNRRAAKRVANSDELVAQLKLEMAAKEQTEKSKENSPEMPMPMMDASAVIKEEPMDYCGTMEVQVQRPIITENGASHNKRSAEAAPAAHSTKPKQPRKSKPINSTVSGSNPTQQPLAIIPPLPPPPPPPEPIYNMPYQLPRSILKAPPPPPAPSPLRHHSMQSNGSMDSDLGLVRKGRLHSVVSPITQIRIYKNYILAAAEDGDLYIFNLHNHKLERQIPKHGEAITNMHLCEKESFLYTTSLDGFLKKSSLENLESVQQTVYVKEPLQSIDIAWDAAFIGSRWGHIFVYNVVTNKMIESPLLSTAQSIIAVKATKESQRKIIILGCKGNFVYLHDAATGLLLRRLGVPDGLNVYSLLLNDGHIYCGTQKNEIFKFEFTSGNLVTKLSCGNGAVSMVSFRDRYLLIGCYDGFIYVLDKHKGTQLGRFEGAGRLVLALAIAGDSIVTSSKDNSLEVLEVPPELLNAEQQ